MGAIGRKVEKMFHSLVQKLLPYIEIQPVTSHGAAASTESTPVTDTVQPPADPNADDTQPPPAKVRRMSPQSPATNLDVGHVWYLHVW